VGHQQKKESAFDGRPTRLEDLLCAGDDLQNHVNDQNVHDCDIRDTVLHVFTSSVELDCRPPEDMKNPQQIRAGSQQRCDYMRRKLPGISGASHRLHRASSTYSRSSKSYTSDDLACEVSRAATMRAHGGAARAQRLWLRIVIVVEGPPGYARNLPSGQVMPG
jgi:hypothetical protein